MATSTALLMWMPQDRTPTELAVNSEEKHHPKPLHQAPVHTPLGSSAQTTSGAHIFFASACWEAGREVFLYARWPIR